MIHKYKYRWTIYTHSDSKLAKSE